jgi:hypothetical protein
MTRIAFLSILFAALKKAQHTPRSRRILMKGDSQRIVAVSAPLLRSFGGEN